MGRILFLSQLIPYPPDSGPKVRGYHLLEYLAQKHQVTLLAFQRPVDSSDAISHLEKMSCQVYTVPIQRSNYQNLKHLFISLATGQSFIIRRDTVPKMQVKTAWLLARENFDAIHVDQLWMAQYALKALSALKDRPLLVLDEHNACFQIFQRLAIHERNSFKRLFYEREWRLLRRYERKACRKFNRVVTVSDEDRKTLSALLDDLSAEEHDRMSVEPNKPSFHTIPIGIDTANSPAHTPLPDTKIVLHIGTMFWLPNVEGILWFLQEVWPRVAAEVPEARLVLIGKKPPAKILRFARATERGSCPGNPAKVGRIEAPGYVADTGPYYQEAAVFIVPLLSGSGMRVKILEAWRRGVPVVSTSIGAEGIDYRDGENILIADRPQEFAVALCRLLSDPVLSQRLSINGQAWVRSHYDWRVLYPAWEDIYAK